MSTDFSKQIDEEIMNIFYGNEGQSATTNTDNTTCTTVDDIIKAVEKIWREPIAEWMRERGFDPKDGCKLVFPKDVWYTEVPHPDFVPDYVILSKETFDIVLLRGMNYDFGRTRT